MLSFPLDKFSPLFISLSSILLSHLGAIPSGILGFPGPESSNVRLIVAWDSPEAFRATALYCPASPAYEQNLKMDFPSKKPIYQSLCLKHSGSAPPPYTTPRLPASPACVQNLKMDFPPKKTNPSIIVLETRVPGFSQFQQDLSNSRVLSGTLRQKCK